MGYVGNDPNKDILTSADIEDGSILTADLADSSVTLAKSSANINQGTARAWVNFNGTGTVAIRDSFNVSSITDNGTGDYTVNFDQDMPNVNYSAVGVDDVSSSTSSISSETLNYLVGSVDYRSYLATAGVDPTIVELVIFGDAS